METMLAPRFFLQETDRGFRFRVGSARSEYFPSGSLDLFKDVCTRGLEKALLSDSPEPMNVGVWKIRSEEGIPLGLDFIFEGRVTPRESGAIRVRLFSQERKSSRLTERKLKAALVTNMAGTVGRALGDVLSGEGYAVENIGPDLSEALDLSLPGNIAAGFTVTEIKLTFSQFLDMITILSKKE